MKGFLKHCSYDDLTRHYQLQIALHLAAFHGFLELGHSALRLGARSDRPVGEHPCRQWSSETTIQDMPEMLKCPIHVAIERGHMKMVDLFVRQSVLCTQVPHPISGLLPYRMALSLSMSLKTKVEKQRYSKIYFYLHDKQFNFKIPLNASGGHSSSLLTSTSSIKSLYQSSSHQVFFSLPRYYKIIRWYERAQERVWKKYGVHIHNSIEIKRSFQSKGLLGYKVMIDGFNNTFDASNEPICSVTSSRKSKLDQTDRYSDYIDEENEKIHKMKAYMEGFGAVERQRTKPPAVNNLRKLRHIPFLSQYSLLDAKLQPIDLTSINSAVFLEGIMSPSEISNSQGPSSFIGLDHQCSKFIFDMEKSLNISRTQLNAANPATFEPNKGKFY
ncbi:unnamed protein product [Rotaria sordida]|uniref:Uncharacterized protein n=1 Tax=Rotaria sordida TaxID=392033 RepID=A0A814PA08_9BILA|nr:unnamed protein product [Rotaria sordida]